MLEFSINQAEALLPTISAITANNYAEVSMRQSKIERMVLADPRLPELIELNKKSIET